VGECDAWVMVDPIAERAARRYLSQLDRVLPGMVVGMYLVGSAALGAYRERRSDIDFVAIVNGTFGASELRRLRLQHVRSGLYTAGAALRAHRSPLTGTCNGVFVHHDDLGRPVTQITPVANHVGTAFHVGRAGSDVSPVGWKVLAERGIALRGPPPSDLGLDPQPELLRSWNLDNLDRYWRGWATETIRAPRIRFALRPQWSTAWGVLGPPRLHCTASTGEVISKEKAGEYALAEFSSCWQPLIRDALAYWREQPSELALSAEQRGRLTAEFVFHVIDSVGF
jgi:Domain of unknown function (DUF4111)/Nucleotidyltransferase domain